MAINYANMRTLADRLISENGTTGVLSKETVTAYDPITDTETATRADYNVDVVVLPFKNGNTMELDIIAKAGLTISSAVKVMIPALSLPVGVIPAPGDYLSLASTGASWTVLALTPVMPDGNPIFHTLICGRGDSRQ